MRTLRALSLLLVGALVAATAHAQAGARLFGQVQDQDGEPLAGVKITVTTPAISTFEIEETTDEKGAFRITLIDATKVYHWRFEKAGYETFEEPVKIGIGQNERRYVKLKPADPAAVEGEAPSGVGAAIEAFNAGADAFSQGDTPTARLKFEEAIAADPNLSAAHAALARVHLEEKRPAEAAAAAERAIELQPENTTAIRVAISAYDELGDAEKLAAAQQKLAAADPAAAAGALYADGVRLFNDGKTEEAATTLEQAVTADPDNAKAHYVLGLCYSGLGQSDKAKVHFETFLRLAPNDEDAAAAQEMLKYL